MEIIKLLHSAYSAAELTPFLTNMLLANTLLGSDLIIPNTAAKTQAKAQAEQIAGVVAKYGGDLPAAIETLTALGQTGRGQPIAALRRQSPGNVPGFPEILLSGPDRLRKIF